ncbi:hypothetical protein N9D05_05810, partial [Alphaproteobacteria bacterium]|nr:hypothetical protein [Alphaproteobacteria bacterium]
PKCGNTLHNCTGTYTWENGNKYIGDWQNNKRHGFGTFKFKDGGQYVGEWVSDKMTGEGVVTYADGEKIEGVFKDSKFLYAKKLKTNTIEKRLKAKAKELVNKANKVKSKNNSKTTGYSKWKWGESPSVGFSNLHPAIKFIIKNEIGGSLLAIEEATKCSFKARYKFAGEIYKLKTDFNKINWKTQSRFYSDDTIKFKYTCEENCFYGLYKFNNYKWSAKKQIFFEFRNKNNMYRRAKDAMSDLSKVCNKSSSKY